MKIYSASGTCSETIAVGTSFNYGQSAVGIKAIAKKKFSHMLWKLINQSAVEIEFDANQ